MTTDLYILSGGAAQSWIASIQPAFEAKHDVRMHATFGAVGAMKQKLLDGAPCDLLILSRALINELMLTGHVEVNTDKDIGVVNTGVAVKDGAALPDVSTAEGLKQTLLNASGVFFPDPKLATAGIHFMKGMTELGVANLIKNKLYTFPNGNIAMRALADSKDMGGVGCTQETEIKFTPGVQWVGELPAGYELATVYCAGIAVGSENKQMGEALVGEFSNRG